MRNSGVHIYIRRSADRRGYRAECDNYPELSCSGKTKTVVRDKIVPLVLAEESRRHRKIEAHVPEKKVRFGF